MRIRNWNRIGGIIILAMGLVGFSTQAVAQEVLINESGGTPDASAALEVQSTTKGMLVPRVTTTQMNAISSPATGLLVYNSTLGTFFFYNGSSWVDLSEDDLGNHVATQNIELDGNYLSDDGDNEGVSISSTGHVTLTPTPQGSGQNGLDVKGDIITSGNSTGIKFSSGNIKILGNSGGSGDMQLYTNGISRMTLLSGGNVGIGTSSPNYHLQIHEGSSAQSQLQFTNTTTGTTGSDGTVLGLSANEDFLLLHRENTAVKFYSNNLERMTISNGGLIGIGTTTPTSALHISVDGGPQLLVSPASTTSNDGSVTIRGARNTSTSNFQAKLNFENYDDDLGSSNKLGRIAGVVTNATTNVGDLAFYSYADGSTESLSMRIASNGNVGMGTSSPNRKLHLHNSSSNNTYLQISNQTSGSSSTDGLLIGQPSNNTYFYNLENGYMAFRTNNTERLRIEAGGDVGIGITNPTAKLHVSGTTNLAGNTTITGNATVSSKTTTASLKVTGGSPATNKVLVSDADGDATWSNLPSSTRSFPILVSNMSDDVLKSGSTTFGTSGSWHYRYLQFPDGGTYDAALSFPIPADYAGTTMTFRIGYSSNSTIGNFQGNVAVRTRVVGDNLDFAPGGGSFTIAAPSTANDLAEFTITHTISSSTKYVYVLIRRNGASASDTSTGNFRIYSINVEYSD